MTDRPGDPYALDTGSENFWMQCASNDLRNALRRQTALSDGHDRGLDGRRRAWFRPGAHPSALGQVVQRKRRCRLTVARSAHLLHCHHHRAVGRILVKAGPPLGQRSKVIAGRRRQEDLWTRRAEIEQKAKNCSTPVADAWRDYDATLVVDDRRLLSTSPAEEFFNEHRFAPRLVDNRFLHAVPTSLTTLGLLGTFLGLTVGLRAVDLGSTTDELRDGIQTLVAGAALGFTASLWGVAMSLVTNVFERWQERRVVRSVRALQLGWTDSSRCTRLSSRSPRLPSARTNPTKHYRSCTRRSGALFRNPSGSLVRT